MKQHQMVLLAVLALMSVPLPAEAPVIRLACVGDSITEGYGVTAGRSWPDQIQAMLGDGWRVGNFGKSGTTLLREGDSHYRRCGQFAQAKAFDPHVVVIMLGTNDTKAQNWAKRSGFMPDYQALIAEFQALPQRPRIFLCRPSFIVGEGKFGISQANTLELLPVIDALGERAGLPVIDIHGAMAKHPELIPDRVHPNDDGATVIAETVHAALTARSIEAAAGGGG